jgi:hypothetical protein
MDDDPQTIRDFSHTVDVLTAAALAEDERHRISRVSAVSSLVRHRYTSWATAAAVTLAVLSGTYSLYEAQSPSPRTMPGFDPSILSERPEDQPPRWGGGQDPLQRQREAEQAAVAKRTAEQATQEAAASKQATEPGFSEQRRTALIQRVQQVLKRNLCYDGPDNGKAGEVQEDVARFIRRVRESAKGKLQDIDLAKATDSEFDAWLRDAEAIQGPVSCQPTVAR